MISDERSRYKSWSNLKKQMQDLLCESLKDKITYFYTGYHEVHNAYGRATINHGKKELLVFSWVEMYKQRQDVCQLYSEGKKISYEELESKKWMPDCVLCEGDFITSITIYLKTDIASSLQSENYLLRIFAYMDRRIGKRTLLKIKDEVEALPEWVQQFYRLRCEADGVVFSPKRMTDEIIEAHKFCHNHKKALLNDQKCGCFFCLEIFDPKEIEYWVEDTAGTAICPYCDVDSVIGESSGYPITKEFLTKMKMYWF